MYNLIKYIDNYYRDEPALNDNGAIVDFTIANSITDLFQFKEKITGKIGNNGTKPVEIMVTLKYLSNFWRTLQMPLTNCETDLDLNWFKNCLLVANSVDEATMFSVTDTKLHVQVVTLSTQDNAKLLEQFKSGFKRTFLWNKHHNKFITSWKSIFHNVINLSYNEH